VWTQARGHLSRLQLCAQRVWVALSASARRHWLRLRGWLRATSFLKRTKAYWLKSLAAIFAGVAFGHWMIEHDVGLPLRYEVSRLVQQLQPRQDSQRTTLVLIADDEFWRGSLARRIPIHRDYLATLIRVVASCDPSVIALDFKLRSPVFTGTLQDRYGTVRDNRDYIRETAKLAETLMEISRTTPVVLPISKSDDQRFVEPSVLDKVPENPGHLVRGNITLPWDYRQIPTSETIGARRVNSLALSTAAILKPELLSKFTPDKEDPYDLAFIAPKDFPTVYYREVTGFPSEQECWQKIRHRVVIVGGAWHATAYQTGDLDDLRKDTPIGPVAALYLHANYAEALLEGRARGFIGDRVTTMFEILSSVLIALVLAANAVPTTGSTPQRPKGERPLLRLKNFAMRHLHTVKYASAVAMAVLLLFLTYLCAQNFNLYADFCFPGAFVFLHALWHDWEELKADQRKLRTLEQEVERLRSLS